MEFVCRVFVGVPLKWAPVEGGEGARAGAGRCGDVVQAQRQLQPTPAGSSATGIDGKRCPDSAEMARQSYSCMSQL